MIKFTYTKEQDDLLRSIWHKKITIKSLVDEYFKGYPPTAIYWHGRHKLSLGMRDRRCAGRCGWVWLEISAALETLGEASIPDIIEYTKISEGAVHRNMQAALQNKMIHIARYRRRMGPPVRVFSLGAFVDAPYPAPIGFADNRKKYLRKKREKKFRESAAVWKI